MAKKKRDSLGRSLCTPVPDEGSAGEGQVSGSRLPTPDVPVNDNVFLCRRVYDYKLKRLLRNPYIGNIV